MIHSAPARYRLRSKSGATESPRDRQTDFHFLSLCLSLLTLISSRSSKRFARSFYYHLKETHPITCLHDHTRNDLINQHHRTGAGSERKLASLIREEMRRWF